LEVNILGIGRVEDGHGRELAIDAEPVVETYLGHYVYCYGALVYLLEHFLMFLSIGIPEAVLDAGIGVDVEHRTKSESDLFGTILPHHRNGKTKHLDS
jgi:hypothetical protein